MLIKGGTGAKQSVIHCHHGLSRDHSWMGTANDMMLHCNMMLYCNIVSHWLNPYIEWPCISISWKSSLSTLVQVMKTNLWTLLYFLQNSCTQIIFTQNHPYWKTKFSTKWESSFLGDSALCCNSVPDDQITTKFSMCHDSIAVVSMQNFAVNTSLDFEYEWTEILSKFVLQ